MTKKKIDKEKEDPKVVNDTPVVDEENLPVLNLEDCETFDPSAEKKADQPSDEEEWDDIGEGEDYTD